MNEIDILDLIETKDFDNLNESETVFVLNEMTREEYESQRQTHKQLIAHFDSGSLPSPPSFQIPETNETRKPEVIGRQRSLPFIPTIVVAASMVFIAFWLGRYFAPKKLVPGDERIVYQTVRDTVTVTEVKEVQKPVKQLITKVVYQKEQSPIELPSVEILDEKYLPSFEGMPDLSSIGRSFGNTSVDERELEQFKVRL